MCFQSFGSPRVILTAHGRCQDLRETEVENFRVTSLRDEDVGGFDVAVHDSFRVGCIQSVRNLDGQRQNQLRFQRTPSNPVCQRHAVQKFHRDEGLVTVLADVVNGADVRMVESRGRTSFTPEAFQCLRVSGHVIRQELERNEAT